MRYINLGFTYLLTYNWYQIILLGDRGIRVWTTCTRSIPSNGNAKSRTCCDKNDATGSKYVCNLH